MTISDSIEVDKDDDEYRKDDEDNVDDTNVIGYNFT